MWESNLRFAPVTITTASRCRMKPKLSLFFSDVSEALSCDIVVWFGLFKLFHSIA